MAWRAKVAGVILVGAGLAGTAVYLTDYRGGASSSTPPNTYIESASYKLESGQPIQIRVSRCDLGLAGKQLICKVYGEVMNLSQTEIPSRSFSFSLRDGYDRVYEDQSPLENSDVNTFELRPGQKHELVLKYLIEPISVRSSLELVTSDGARNVSKLIQIKTGEPWELALGEGEWRAFREPHWKP